MLTLKTMINGSNLFIIENVSLASKPSQPIDTYMSQRKGMFSLLVNFIAAVYMRISFTLPFG